MFPLYHTLLMVTSALGWSGCAGRPPCFRSYAFLLCISHPPTA
eukprot:COSAG01_NODE_5127_length_4469_cov_4.479405_8_plen_42_part_01